jgi:hypothetical protein
MLVALVLPVVAVQVAPGEPAPLMEEQLLRACSAGLERARCVSARGLGGEKPRGIALVSWLGGERVSIEVGLASGDAPLWVSRELAFASADPEQERWRAVGLTIALLADDPRFWAPVLPAPSAPEARPAVDAPSAASADGAPRPGNGVLAELRGLTGTGVVSGPLRWGAELRMAVPFSSLFFFTGSVDYALASDTSLDVRWFDATLGLGLSAGSLFSNVDARLRFELLGENVAVTARRDGFSDRASAWVPGVSVGADLLWSVADPWLLGAGVDAFWVDGSTAILSAGERVGAVAGAGVMLGLGVGHRF